MNNLYFSGPFSQNWVEYALRDFYEYSRNERPARKPVETLRFVLHSVMPDCTDTVSVKFLYEAFEPLRLNKEVVAHWRKVAAKKTWYGSSEGLDLNSVTGLMWAQLYHSFAIRMSRYYADRDIVYRLPADWPFGWIYSEGE